MKKEKEASSGNLTALSSKLQKKGINVFAVGVKRFKQSELEEIASDLANVYTTLNFETLHELSDRLSTDFCEGNYGL